MDISIIIVNYNTKQLLFNCLKSIFEKTRDISFEVIVSDNGSTDGSIEMLKEFYPQVILLENNKNLGFGTANNKALAFAKGKYIFYLNSDTILLNNAVKCFFDYWEENDESENLGALGCILQNVDGTQALSGGSFLGNDTNIQILKKQLYFIFSTYYKAIKHYLFGYKLKTIKSANHIELHQEPGFIDSITGADLFLKNNIHAKFDEKYFMYCEEVDLQYQMEKIGLKRKLISTPKIIHLEGCSSNKETIEVLDLVSFSKINDTISRLYFLKKNNFSKLRIIIIKISSLILWLNPLVYSKTKSYIKFLFKPEYRTKGLV